MIILISANPQMAQQLLALQQYQAAEQYNSGTGLPSYPTVSNAYTDFYVTAYANSKIYIFSQIRGRNIYLHTYLNSKEILHQTISVDKDISDVRLSDGGFFEKGSLTPRQFDLVPA